MIYENALILSVTQLKRKGLLTEGIKKEGTITFSVNGEPHANIKFNIYMAIESPELILSYSANGVPIRSVIRLYRQESNLGKGFYYYFICPYTGKKARKLYCFGKRFLHREAYIGSMYEIQTQTHEQRYFTRYWKAREAEEKMYQPYYRPLYANKPTVTAKRIEKKLEWLDATLWPRIDKLLTIH